MWAFQAFSVTIFVAFFSFLIFPVVTWTYNNAGVSNGNDTFLNGIIFMSTWLIYLMGMVPPSATALISSKTTPVLQQLSILSAYLITIFTMFITAWTCLHCTDNKSKLASNVFSSGCTCPSLFLFHGVLASIGVIVGLIHSRATTKDRIPLQASTLLARLSAKVVVVVVSFVFLELPLCMIYVVHWFTAALNAGSVMGKPIFDNYPGLRDESIPAWRRVSNFFIFLLALGINTWALKSIQILFSNGKAETVTASTNGSTCGKLSRSVSSRFKHLLKATCIWRLLLSLYQWIFGAMLVRWRNVFGRRGVYFKEYIVLGEVVAIPTHLDFMFTVASIVPTGQWTFAMVLLLSCLLISLVIVAVPQFNRSRGSVYILLSIHSFADVYFLIYNINAFIYLYPKAAQADGFGNALAAWIGKLALGLTNSKDFAETLPFAITLIKLSLRLVTMSGDVVQTQDPFRQQASSKARGVVEMIVTGLAGSDEAADARLSHAALTSSTGSASTTTPALQSTKSSTVQSPCLPCRQLPRNLAKCAAMILIAGLAVCIGSLAYKYEVAFHRCFTEVWEGDEVYNWCSNANYYPEGFFKPVQCNCRAITVPHCSDGKVKTIPPRVLMKLNTALTVSGAGCNLHGSIPHQIGGMEHLVGIYLGKNDLTGNLPESLGNLTMLETAIFETNQLTGTIPASLGRLLTLQCLYLDKNNFTNTVPTSVFQLPNLMLLTLGSPSLHGTIPDDIGTHLLQIRILHLHHMNMSGILPESIGDLKNLQLLQLENNQFTGSLPQSFRRLASHLEILWLQNNHFNGTFPSYLTSKLESPHLVDLQIAGNDFINSKAL